MKNNFRLNITSIPYYGMKHGLYMDYKPRIGILSGAPK